MFDSVQGLLAEHEQLALQLSDPAIHADAARAKKVNRRYAELNQIVAAHSAWQQAQDDLAAARELAREDEAFAEEVPALEEVAQAAQEKLHRLLIPRDPDDGRDVIMEIKGGEGGEESALFAADLLRMYLHYAESRGWKTELLERTESDLGGYKDVQVAIKSNATDPAQGVWASLKYEGGVHRVQRVPATESQGRIHTSTTGVLVFPEVDAPEEIEISQNDLRIDVFRSSGPGGQSVNTTDSAVRITHLPTGLVVSMQNEKSQIQNREAGMRVLRARLLARQQEELAQASSDARRSQIRTMDRSERIRTYNFPENRIADHRTGYKAYNLDQVMNGAIGPLIESCIAADEEARLSELAAGGVTEISLGTVRERAVEQLATAGVPTPQVDADLLIGHVLGLSRGEVQAKSVTDSALAADDARAIRAAVERRSAREPLQHITGRAPFRSLELAVGPGVFVPRPETELVAQLAIDALLAVPIATPRAADLGTGSGAIALALATEVPHAQVVAVENSPEAFIWARQNVREVGAANIRLIFADLADTPHELDGTLDVVVSNPPYIPLGAVPRDPEVRLFDPEVALYGGADGFDVVRVISRRAGELLRPGGLLVLEHGEYQGQPLRELLTADGWTATATHRDLIGRDRATTAIRSSAGSGTP